MSCSPLQATSASPIASCISPWLRSARRIERTPPRPSVRCSTKRRQSSPALACGFASQCVHHHVSGLPSPARQSSAAPPRLLPRFPDRRRNRTSLHYAMSGGLKLCKLESTTIAFGSAVAAVDRKQDHRTGYENHKDTLANARLLPHLPLPIGADAPQRANL